MRFIALAHFTPWLSLLLPRALLMPTTIRACSQARYSHAPFARISCLWCTIIVEIDLVQRVKPEAFGVMSWIKIYQLSTLIYIVFYRWTQDAGQSKYNSAQYVFMKTNLLPFSPSKWNYMFDWRLVVHSSNTLWCQRSIIRTIFQPQVHEHVNKPCL